MGFDKKDGAIKQAKRDTIIAIDFGTHGSGFAFSVHGRTWLHETYPDSDDLVYPKTRTALLYSNGRSVKAWGHTALKEFLGDAGTSASFRLVENFKLALEDPDAAGRLPFGLTSLQVVADYLEKLHRYTMCTIRNEVGRMASHKDRIQWVLTVPAIWKDSSKALMRTAAQRAGLIRAEDSDQLAIITEPEAAALHALKNRFPPLNPGEVIQIIDAGGGTVDISVHHCVERNSGHVVLEEAIFATGAMCGSTSIDEAFKVLYREAVGHAAFDSWIHNHPVQWQQVLQHFEMRCKRSFVGNKSSSSSSSNSSSTVSISNPKFRVEIPSDLHAHMSDDQKNQLFVNQGTDFDVVLDEKMEDLFEYTVNKTTTMATEKLQELGPMYRCSRILLVGGLASSLYLTNRLRGALIDRLNLADSLTVPLHPYASVLRGGVAYGCEPALIHARRSCLSYGVRLHSAWEDGAPKASKYWHEEEGNYFTSAKFLPPVYKNQLVEREEEVNHIVVPGCSTNTLADIELFASTDVCSMYIGLDGSDMHALCSLHLDLPPDCQDAEQIAIKLLFGQGEISASACIERTQEVVSAKFIFAHK